MKENMKKIIIGGLVIFATFLTINQLLHMQIIIEVLQQTDLGSSILEAIGIIDNNEFIYGTENSSIFSNIWFAALGPFLLILALEIKLLTTKESY